ncbi:MAG TPA: ATP synthase F1 subunit delta [Gemmatimonadaceae bacterium]|nr:ATP synthase F1 subunit delta [Gemmatimonadaceae bacterium]
MRDSTIARNYAQTLLELATKSKQVDAFAGLINGVADAVRSDPILDRFLRAPQVAEVAKRDVLRKALTGKAPATFVRFMEKLVSNRRQTLVSEIAVEFANLVDAAQGRVHATVTVARKPADGDAAALSKRLSQALGKEVVAHLTVNPAILGGVVVRIGDTVMDGSVRRRLGALRHALGSTRQ